MDLQSVKLTPLKDFDLTQDDWGKQLAAPYEPNRSAVILKGAQIWGVVGEYKLSVAKALKLPAFVAGFEVHMDILSNSRVNYRSLPRFPKVEQDICLKVAADLPYQELQEFMTQQLVDLKPENSQLITMPLDIFQRDDDKDHKQVTFRISIASYERTLTDVEVSKILDQIAAAAKEKFGAERI